MIDLRSYRPEDAEALLRVFRRAVRDGAAGDYSPQQLRAWAPDHVDLDAWRQRLAGKHTWVAESLGVPVGFADLASDGLIDLLFVAPDHHRRGVASALLAKIEQAALGCGMARLHTESSITARPFFERHGFVVLAEQTVAVRGQHLRNHLMEKRL